MSETAFQPTVYYTSQKCVIPFQLVDATKYNKEANRLSLSKMGSREARVNSLVNNLEKQGWWDLLKVDFIIDEYDVRFEFSPNEGLMRGTALDLRKPLFFAFSLTNGKIRLGGLTQWNMINSYFEQMGLTQEEIDKRIDRIKSQQFSIQEFIDYLDYYFNAYAPYHKLDTISYKYDKEIFFKLTLLEKNVLATFNQPLPLLSQRPIVRPLMLGRPKHWLPYLQYDITLENLIYLFSYCVNYSGGMGYKTREIIKEESNKLNEEFIVNYSPAEVGELGRTPLEWFSRVFNNGITV